MAQCGPCPWCFSRCRPGEGKEILVESTAGRLQPFQFSGLSLEVKRSLSPVGLHTVSFPSTPSSSSSKAFLSLNLVQIHQHLNTFPLYGLWLSYRTTRVSMIVSAIVNTQVRQTYKNKNCNEFSWDGFSQKMREAWKIHLLWWKYTIAIIVIKVWWNPNIIGQALTEDGLTGEILIELRQEKKLRTGELWLLLIYKSDTQYNILSMRNCNKHVIAMLSLRPSLDPQTKGFPYVSPTRGVLVFVLQYLSVL